MSISSLEFLSIILLSVFISKFTELFISKNTEQTYDLPHWNDMHIVRSYHLPLLCSLMWHSICPLISPIYIISHFILCHCTLKVTHHHLALFLSLHWLQSSQKNSFFFFFHPTYVITRKYFSSFSPLLLSSFLLFTYPFYNFVHSTSFVTVPYNTSYFVYFLCNIQYYTKYYSKILHTQMPACIFLVNFPSVLIPWICRWTSAFGGWKHMLMS